MIVSHKHKFIFIHIPRTAGTRVSKSICKRIGVKNWKKFIGEPSSLIEGKVEENGEWVGNKHIRAKKLKKLVGGKVWKSYFKFSFVRNPWDRAISVYLHNRKNSKLKNVWPKSKKMFRIALKAKYNLLGSNSVQQIDYVTDDRNKVILDFVGKFENLSEDFKFVTKSIGISCKINRVYDSTGKKNHVEWYDESSKNVIRREKKDDINKFNYNFQSE